jgi:hypothetical protein
MAGMARRIGRAGRTVGSGRVDRIFVVDLPRLGAGTVE